MLGSRNFSIIQIPPREYEGRKENEMNIPSRYWEPGSEELGQSEEEIREAEEWLRNNGIPYNEELPFN